MWERWPKDRAIKIGDESNYLDLVGFAIELTPPRASVMVSRRLLVRAAISTVFNCV
jgi:hypothetical protein